MERAVEYGRTAIENTDSDERTDSEIALPQSIFSGGVVFVFLNFWMDRSLSIDEQRQLFTDWLTSSDARQCARRLVDRYRVPSEADDVLSEC